MSDLYLAEARGADKMRQTMRTILDPSGVRAKTTVETLARQVREERDTAYRVMADQRREILALRAELRALKGEPEPVLMDALGHGFTTRGT